MCSHNISNIRRQDGWNKRAEDMLEFNPSSRNRHSRLQRAQAYQSWTAQDSTGRGGAAVMDLCDGTLWSL